MTIGPEMTEGLEQSDSGEGAVTLYANLLY